MKDISKQVISKIGKEGIKPIPKWQVVTKNMLVWMFYFLNIIFGAVTFAIIVYYFVSIEWDVIRFVPQKKFSLLFNLFPYFWVCTFTLFSVFSYFNFMKTPKGYRHNIILIIVVNLLASMLLGCGVFYTQIVSDWNDQIEKKAAPNFVRLRNPEYNREKIWENGKTNLFQGMVLEVDLDKQILVLDNRGRKVRVDFKAYKGELEPEENHLLGVVGVKVSPGLIKASYFKLIDKKSIKDSKYQIFKPKRKELRKEVRKELREKKRIQKNNTNTLNK